MSDNKLEATLTEPPLVGDHLALDLLNTEAGSGALHTDFWRSGEDVLDWLARCGIDVGRLGDQAASDAVLHDARELRASARELVELRKQGERGDPQRINRYLATLQSAPVLEWGEGGPLLTRRLPAPSPQQALGQVAESVAELLAAAQFEYVRQCEHPDCVLWFYDRTKSHRRRWCSMALCGNRHKAAEFRKRNRAAA
ncbi:CGNR zinc finger domain-containing protein [Massilia sp. CFBP9012]|uniref:CGNR zinc finger domain-containing protein n=1 Tax=Massilia sp. CFBP9012 TaxID=3096531 RepID=UPI002A6AFC0E|nr:ABATE domain-containing protein [Massilia sp. CFBP9012]MDY0975630.1 CGNR zinc finger domain-containing protein [Massilia sp. CFBP9012]